MKSKRWWAAVIGAVVLAVLAATVLVYDRYVARPGSAAERPVPAAWPSASVPDALARGDIGAAERFWQEAYRVALASRRWEALVEVGDAWLRIAHAAGVPRRAEPAARRLYLKALLLARQEGSLEGVLRVTEAFHALGDRDVVVESLRLAEHLARSSDEEGRARFAHLRNRLAARASSANDAP